MGFKKVRDILAVSCVALFFMTHEMVFIWLLIVSVIFFHPENKGWKKGRLKKKIVSDGNRHGVQIPRNKAVREKLNAIYERYESSRQIYPHLQEHYDELLNRMWLSLASDKDIETWQYLLKSILKDWPADHMEAKKNLKEKLDEVGRLTHQWNEARQEAMGES